jgi:hypothetical protein
MLVGLLIVLSACGASSPPAKPAVWTKYQNDTFAMNYFSNWGVGTKDLYLGTSYPELEMLHGMAFTSPDNATTFVQVISGTNTSGKASVSDLLRQAVLGTPQKPAASASLTTTTLDGVTWSQSSIEKQATTADGSSQTVKETALGISYPAGAKQPVVYLILYQDAVNTYSTTSHDVFSRMVNSFRFVAAK